MSAIPEQLIEIYRERLARGPATMGGSHQHVRDMTEKLKSMTNVTKANRWLGFIQGYCWVSGLFSIDQMRQHVRDHIFDMLIDFQVVGISHHQEDYDKANVKPGDELALKLEPDNKVDKQAIKIMKGDCHIGYVPRDMANAIRDAMAAYTGRLVVTGAGPEFCAVTMQCRER